jgi:hypothetical protein
VAEPGAEIGVLVVHDAYDPVLHSEGVGVIVAYLVMRKLDHPAVQVLAVEKLNPVCRLLREAAAGAKKQNRA